MSKFKVGDKVIIKHNLRDCKGAHSVGVSKSMIQLSGNIYKIEETLSNDRYKLNGLQYSWTEDMLSPLNLLEGQELLEVCDMFCDRYELCSDCPLHPNCYADENCVANYGKIQEIVSIWASEKNVPLKVGDKVIVTDWGRNIQQ